MRDIAMRAGVDGKEAIRKVSYWAIVKAAGSAFDPQTNPALVSWKLCSGFAHGDSWPTWAAADRIELPGAPPGLSTFNVTANVKMLMYVTAFAVHLTRLGWHLYDQRSRPPF